MPITAITCWIGALALIGTPFFSGFYSKDSLIEAVGESHRYGSGYAYFCVMAGVFITALYSFRLLFMTFHGEERFRHGAGHDAGHGHDTHDEHGHDAHGHGSHGAEPHESRWVVTGPLIALAIPSVLIGAIAIQPLLFGDYFGRAIFVREANDVVHELGREFPGWFGFALHGMMTPPFFLAAAGVATAWYLFLRRPDHAAAIGRALAPLRKLLDHKYYFDEFNEKVIARGSRLLGRALWKGGDQGLIDGALVNGSASAVGRLAGAARLLQTGFLYSYAFWMVIGLALLLGWFLFRAMQ
jgi:NADH-quinone oxidoreductase subunit L